MPCRRPLRTTHPELTVIAQETYVEYRVHNHHLARDGSGRTVFNFSSWTFADGLLPVVLSVLWPIARGSWTGLGALALALGWYGRYKLTQVLWESVVILPPHGIQLETHWGFPSIPLFASRRFIPVHVLEDFVINEGLRGWNVRCYLAAITQPSQSSYHLAVAFEHILPHFAVLREVYRGVQTELLHSCNVPDRGIVATDE